MTTEELPIRDVPDNATLQRAIAAQLSPLFKQIDLTIPAQRAVAEKVRSDLVPQPTALNDAVTMNIEGDK